MKRREFLAKSITAAGGILLAFRALINAGDTHTLKGADRYWIETDRTLKHADDIRGIILDGAYVNRAKE